MEVEAAAGETPSLTGEFIAETHRVLEHTQTHLIGKQQQKGPIGLWVVEGMTENQQSGSSTIAPYGIPPPHTESQ